MTLRTAAWNCGLSNVVGSGKPNSSEMELADAAFVSD
jgi:hypothetical protein